MGLTVAVTGPTGEIGRSVVRALERAAAVERILGMARRRFDPAEQGWEKASYRQGDILDRESVIALVEGADVVVHLAFIIFGEVEQAREVNLQGSANVFEASAAAGVSRLVYTSSVAAYGFHADNPQPLTEDVPPRGSDDLYYSAQKAELEDLLARSTEGSATDVYVFRPCVVAGRDAPALVRVAVEAATLGNRLGAVRRAVGSIPGVAPVLPDPGLRFQLVHHDDVADAIRAAALGEGPPGTYNLAAEGTTTTSELASELGWHSVPVPRFAIDALAEATARLPLMPPQAAWLNAARRPVLMDCSRAHAQLGWRPRHDATSILRETVGGAREQGVLGGRTAR